MDLSFFLEQQLINNIIMYARPTYPYIPELNNLYNLWYDNDSYFCQTFSNTLILDAIRLKKYFQQEFNMARLETEWKLYINN
jgi:hypothetical protein